MIEQFPGVNDPTKLKVLVTDAAACMKKAGSKDSNKVYESNVCIDHVLNTSLCSAEKKSVVIEQLFGKCKSLAARTHQSTNDWIYIQRKCKDKGINAIKITQPVSTRWNSNCMMLESLVKMKPALENIAIDPSARDELAQFIPDAYEFEMIQKLWKYLRHLKKYSEKWSSEKNVSIAGLLTDLYAIKILTVKLIQKQRDQFPAIADFMKVFLEELQMHNPQVQRLKNLGLENRIYRIAHYLHPFFKGHALRKGTLCNGQNAFEHTEQYLIDKHPSTSR
jgi:hypothetical protein